MLKVNSIYLAVAHDLSDRRSSLHQKGMSKSNEGRSQWTVHITMNKNLLFSSISDSNDTLALSIPCEIITTTWTINSMSNERTDSTYIGPDMTLYSPLSTLSWPTVSQMRTVSEGRYLILALSSWKPTSPRCVSGCAVEAWWRDAGYSCWMDMFWIRKRGGRILVV